MLSNYNYALDVSKSVNIKTASALLNEELTKRGVHLINDEGNLALKQQLEGGEYTKYIVENQEMTPTGLADKVLADHKLLKVTETDTPPAPPAPGTPPVLPANGDPKYAPGVKEAYENSMNINKEIIEQSQIT